MSRDSAKKKREREREREKARKIKRKKERDGETVKSGRRIEKDKHLTTTRRTRVRRGKRGRQS